MWVGRLGPERRVCKWSMRGWPIDAIALGMCHSRMTVVHEWHFGPPPTPMRHLRMRHPLLPTPYVIAVVVVVFRRPRDRPR